jgi:putative DNA primase/helicase
VVRSLQAVGLTPCIAELDGLPPKGDIRDWLRNHSQDDLDAVVAAAKPYEEQEQAAAATGPRPVVVTMSDVQAEAVQWLWWPYIAIGKLCMLDGDPGIGKTLLMTQLAASLSQGQPLPDQQGKPTLDPGGPQTTLLLSTEDGLADTLKPRLEAAGADCTKVHVLTGWLGEEDEFHTFTLQHMDMLEAAVKQYHPRLIVIDPIQAYLGDIDIHRANETRPLLAALTRQAEQYHCAIVYIRHPAKAKPSTAVWAASTSSAPLGPPSSSSSTRLIRRKP